MARSVTRQNRSFNRYLAHRDKPQRDHDQMLADLDKIMGKVCTNLDAGSVMADFIFGWTANHVLVIERQLAEFVRAHATAG